MYFVCFFYLKFFFLIITIHSFDIFLFVVITGSLYDLWNQNYIVMGSNDDPKYYARVALGAYANPMLYVTL